MDPLIAFRGNAMGNLSATPQQRTEAFKRVTATYRSQVEAANGQGAQFKAMLAALQKVAAGGSSATVPKGVASKSVVSDNSGDSGTPTRGSGNELGKDTYLQLLVTQMSNQDPLSPMDNTAMVAQLAQFSSLEQMQNLNDKFETLSGNVDQLNFISAEGMLGKYVQGLDADKNPVKGFVRSVGLDGSIVMLDVDGKALPMSGVLTVGGQAPTPTPATSSSKVDGRAGKTVRGGTS